MVVMALVLCRMFIILFKQKTAYEMRISDWSSDVCSSDLKYQYTLIYYLLKNLQISAYDDLSLGDYLVRHLRPDCAWFGSWGLCCGDSCGAAGLDDGDCGERAAWGDLPQLGLHSDQGAAALVGGLLLYHACRCLRSEERRVGKECVRTCRSRVSAKP